MIQRLQAKRNSEEGFTLIELLIVIIVLGILAAIVVFAVAGTRGDAVASSCKTAYVSVELSAESVFLDDGLYSPGLVTDAFPAVNPLVAPEDGALLKTWPTEPGDDYLFQYKNTSNLAATPPVHSFEIDVYKKGTTFTAAGVPVAGSAMATTAAFPGVEACTNL